MRLLILLISMILWSGTTSLAQDGSAFLKTDSTSYVLYQQARWKELMVYGKEALANYQDFPLLRLRMGYAAFMLGRYSEAIRHYEQVLKADSFNETAHYFIYWSRINLAQPQLAMASLKYTDAKDIPLTQKKKAGIESALFEASIKRNSLSERGQPTYFRAGFGHRFSHQVHMEHMFSSYRQVLNEPALTAVTNNEKITVNQFEYYNKLVANLDAHWQFKAAWHYLRTPFNNFNYNNHLFMAGFKYHGTYANLQADMVLGRITDSNSRQFNIELQWYPLGNLKVYSFSTAMMRSQGSTDFHFRQVFGFQLLHRAWIEGHITTGTFHNLAENDALYLYNAIDPNRIKAGAGLYFQFGRTLLQMGYVFEERERYGTKQIFQQHSINGGLSWKF